MTVDGPALVRIAQLRGRIAAFARGGHYELVEGLLGDLIRADLGAGLTTDALLRARQTAGLASARGEPLARPLVVLAATLLAADALGDALGASSAAIEHAAPAERARIEVMARLIGGAAQRRAGRLADARLLLDAARGAAARLGENALAGFALAELAWVDLGEDHPAAAATCFEFAAEFLRHARHAASLEADAIAVAAWASANEPARAEERAAAIVGPAQRAKRADLIAYTDGALADLALRITPDHAAAACGLATQSAQASRGPNARELIVQARFRQVRTSADARERARHLEVAVELALALDPRRAAARLGAFLFDLLDDAARVEKPPARPEIGRLVAAIDGLGDAELADMAHAILAELG